MKRVCCIEYYPGVSFDLISTLGARFNNAEIERMKKVCRICIYKTCKIKFALYSLIVISIGSIIGYA